VYIMTDYDDALAKILKHGVVRTNKRTNSKTRSIFGVQCRYRLDERFPIVTRRKVWPRAVFAELLWFLSGSTNNKDLQALGSNIWTPWVSAEFEQKHGYVEGSLGPTYGHQLRCFDGDYINGDPEFYYREDDTFTGDYHETQHGEGGFDQLLYMVDLIKQDPSSRRILFSLWNPKQLDMMRLPPCCYSFQVCIDDDGKMTGILTMRSGDYPVGCCANVQYYSALTMMLAQQTGYTAYELIHNVADAHIYEPQIPAVEEYLATPIIDSPILKINKAPDILSYKLDDFVLENFQSGPKIKIPVAV
jgi:thymidylate synthase